MATTYKIIDKTTLTGNQSSVSFTGLGAYSSDYTDLIIKISARTTRSDNHEQIKLRFNDNGDTAYRIKRLNGDGGGAWSDTDYTTYGYCGFVSASTATSNTFGNGEIYIPNFSSSIYKSYSSDTVSENNASQAFASLQGGLWEKTAAITKISLFPNMANDFVSGSSFYLYGIKNS